MVADQLVSRDIDQKLLTSRFRENQKSSLLYKTRPLSRNIKKKILKDDSKEVLWRLNSCILSQCSSLASNQIVSMTDASTLLFYIRVGLKEFEGPSHKTPSWKTKKIVWAVKRIWERPELLCSDFASSSQKPIFNRKFWRPNLTAQ